MLHGLKTTMDIRQHFRLLPGRIATQYTYADLARVPVLAMLYLLLAVLAMKFGTVQGNVATLWPASGLALFALLRYGMQLWPGVFIGAFAAGLWIHDPADVSLAIALGNTLDCVAGVWLLRRSNFRMELHRLPDYYRLVLWGGLIATSISALIGPGALLLADYYTADRWADVALHWWMGNTLGVALATPTLLIWRQSPGFLQRQEHLWEAAILWSLSVVLGLMVFSGWHPGWLPAETTILPFWVTPLIIWAALRFGRHGVSLQLLLYFSQSLIGVISGHGLFAPDMAASGLINFWFFHLITSIAAMTLGIALHERRTAAEEVLAEKIRLRSVIDAIPDLIFFKDVDGVYSGCNKAFEAFTDTRESAIVGKKDFDILPRAVADRLRDQDAWALSQQTARTSEEWGTHADGHQVLHETLRTPLRDVHGEVTGLVGISRDITRRRATEQERAMLYETIAASHDEIYIFDADGLHFRFINAGALQNLGYTLQEAHGLTPLNLKPFFTAEDFRQLLAPLFMHEKSLQIFETMHRRKDGSLYPVEVHLQLFETDSERYFLAIVQDISHRLESEHALRLAASVFEHSKQSILITDAAVRIVSVNQSFIDITGFSAAEVIGHNPRLLGSGAHDKAFYQAMWSAVSTTGSWSGEVWNRRKDGTLYVEWLDICTVRDASGQVTNYIGLSYDITDRKAEEESIRHLAQHDFLTGLPNRVLFYDRFEQALAAARRHHTPFAVLFLDLNRFKQINDTLGHRFGDELLKAVAIRLTDIMRATDTICRMGGDEFVILVSELDSAEHAEILTRKLSDKFVAPCTVEGRDIQVSFSIGHAVYPQHGETMESLLEAADAAMYDAKHLDRVRRL